MADIVAADCVAELVDVAEEEALPVELAVAVAEDEEEALPVELAVAVTEDEAAADPVAADRVDVAEEVALPVELAIAVAEGGGGRSRRIALLPQSATTMLPFKIAMP